MRLKSGWLLLVLLVMSTAAPAAEASHSLYAFGWNIDGQLGSSTDLGTRDPFVAPVTLSGGEPVGQAAAGNHFSLVATATGQLYAFGEDNFGQLGRAPVSEEPTPQTVALPEGVVAAAAGGNHSLVITTAGKLYSFGENNYGQLGTVANLGTTNPNPNPTLVSLPGSKGEVVQVAAGHVHSLALTSTGELYAFGGDESGQLGFSGSTANDTPTLVELPGGATGSIKAIAAGYRFSLALTSTGEVYAFGQLGNSTNNGVTTPNPTPTPVTFPGSSTIAQIAAGGYHALALSTTGQLYALGQNRYGQLGNATNNGKSTANPTPALVTLPGVGGTITQIAAGNHDSLVLSSGGQLYAFGENQYGQLGNTANNGTEVANPTPTVVDLSAEALVQGSSADHTLLLGPFISPVTVCGCANEQHPSSTGVTTTTGAPQTPSHSPALRAPVLGAVSLTNRSFRVGRQATAIAARKAPVGTAIHFTLSTTAKLAIVITRSASGLRHGLSCLAPSRALTRAHAKHCGRRLVVQALSRTGEPEGADSVAFSGRLGSHPLAPGAYVALIRASNAAGSSKPVVLSFTVLR